MAPARYWKLDYSVMSSTGEVIGWLPETWVEVEENEDTEPLSGLYVFLKAYTASSPGDIRFETDPVFRIGTKITETQRPIEAKLTGVPLPQVPVQEEQAAEEQATS
jgi:hypothetical protein